MKVLIEGHNYELKNVEKEYGYQTIQFIQKKEKIGGEPGELVTVFDGTTNEEVLEMLIHRIEFLQKKNPCRENSIVITKLEESLMWLKKRTSDRVKRNVEGKNKT